MSETKSHGYLTPEQADAKYVQKDHCVLRGESIRKMEQTVQDTAKDVGEIKVQIAESLGEIRESLASTAQWMQGHEQIHKTQGPRTQTIAVVVATSIAALSLVGTTILGVLKLVFKM